MNDSIRTLLLVLGLLSALSWAPRAGATQPLDSAPRNVQFRNLTTEDGLSSEFVHDLVQDRRGYLWFATQAGLNRFDGHDIRVYEHRPDDPGSLSHSFVWSLHVDRDGVLWVGTDRGVNTYDPASDSFNRQPFGGLASFQRVRKITQDLRGTFWIGTVQSGLLSVDRRNGHVRRYVHDPGRPDSLPSDNVIAIHEDLFGDLWVGTDGDGLAILNRTRDSFSVFRHQPDDDTSLSDDHIRSIYEDRAGRIWIGTAQGGLNRFERERGTFVRYRHDPADPNTVGAGQLPSLFEDFAGTLWVGTEDGLSEWRPPIEGFVNYRRDPVDRRSLVNNRVNAIFQDDSGVLWLATNGGISAWTYLSDTFQYFTSADGLMQSDVVTSVAEGADGDLWVATYGGGLSRLNPETGVVRHWRNDPQDPRSLSDDRVMTVHIDGPGRVWVGTRHAGLSRMNADGSFTHFRHDPADPATLSGDAVTRIFSEADGTVWIGVFGGGLNRLTWSDGDAHFERFRHDPQDPNSLSGDRVLAIHQDHAGTLWVGTEGAGLNRFVAHANRFQRFDIELVHARDGSNPVSGTPWELYESEDGTMWIGTLGQGLMRWSAADRAAGVTRFEQFGVASGLAPDIYGIVQGDRGELWLSSSRGLFRFDPTRATTRRFDRSNGLRSNEFNHGARLKSRSGRLLFGGTNGLVGFYPDHLPHNARPPSIDLVAKSRTQLLARTGVGGVPAVELGYFDPFVAFEFVALDFVSPDNNRYRFRLSGYDIDWNDARDFRRAIYSNLPAGDYRFEVQASNSDGVWNRVGAAMDLTVIPPPWRTGWAYALYALGAAGLVVAYATRQRRKRRNDAERTARLEQLVRERTMELADRNEELLRLNRKFEEASLTDQLTGLRNRRYVDQFIQARMAAVERRQVESIAPAAARQADSSMILFVLMIDLDGFKQLNDAFGHHAGDQALLQVKDRLLNCCRSSDIVVRWGGDEFLVVGNSASRDGVQLLAEKVRRVLADEPYDVGAELHAELSASIGVTVAPFVEGRRGFAGWEQLVAVADHGAYLAKTNGRNAWVSLRGTARMREADLRGIRENLGALIEHGKLVIDSSVEGGVSLQAFSLVQTGTG